MNGSLEQRPDNLAAIDTERFASLAKDQWLQKVSLGNRTTAESIYNQFEEEMMLDPFVLVWQARKAQEVDKILNALKRFYDRCLTRGLSESTAFQYAFVVMKGYFLANRVPLPRHIEKPNPRVALNELFNE